VSLTTEGASAPKVFIATPAYSGQVEAFTAVALIRDMQAMNAAGVETTWFPLTGCCYLPIARNKLVAEFLKTDCTDLIFVDADVYWQPGALLRLMMADVDIVGGIYPLKQDDEQYPVWPKTDDGVPIGRDGMIECWGLPTGFMRIRRRVFDVMRERIANLEVVETDGFGNDKGRYWSFFDTGKLDPDTPTKWWGEDYLFCWRWKQCGGSVWAIPDIDFHHVGLKAWKGNYDKYLRGLK
jgi:glycosyltransferase involved in cell wall biosynthesis